MISAVIPIRKGSQRVKKKNLRKFNKKNLLIYKIEKLKKLKNLDEIIINTDSEEAIEIAKKYVILEKKGTQGDSYGYHASNNYLKKKFKGYKFINLHDGIKRYFQWINFIPVKKNINSYHPFKINKN